MINASFISLVDFKKLKKEADRAAYKALYTLAGYVRQTARRSIKSSKKPSAKGTPYHTQTQFMKNSIWVERAGRTAIVKYIRGQKLGAVHEFGGLNPLNKRRYPAREVFAPALAKAIQDFNKKFPEDFQRYFKHVG